MTRALSILIIDDDEFFTSSLSDFLVNRGFHVQTARNGKSGIETFERQQPPIVLLDQELPDMRGIEVCWRLLELDPGTKILFITAYATVRYAVEAMQAGAFNYLSKPFQLDELLIAVDMAIKNVRLEGKLRVQNYEREKERSANKLIGSSEVMRRIGEQIKLAASSEANVLITGDTGVGKNVVANAIFDLQDKRETLLTINCSAISENLMESEYFGHEKGAFTGADIRREGIFELADGGTLVLDEIGEIPTYLQSKLLSVLEDKTIRRIGGRRNIPIDVRVIATTNQALEEAIQKGHFRQDLYYRLAVIHIHVPTLKEHAEDISEIVGYFVERFCKKPVMVPDSHMDRLVRYPWPGNVRELRNVIERASLLLRGDEMRPGDFLFQGTLNAPKGKRVLRDADRQAILSLEEVQRRHIMHTLKACAGNRSVTARKLGISLSTLKRKLAETNKNLT